MRLDLPNGCRRHSAFRNRMLLVGGVVAAALGLLVWAGVLFSSPRQAPVLMGVDEVPSGGASPAALTHKASTSTAEITIVQEAPAPADGKIRWFNGRPIRPAKTITMRVTAYSPDERSCGTSADGITASGYTVWTNGFKSVAADPRVLPLGSLVSVPGYDAGEVVPVLDTGGAIKGKRLDVLFPSHEVAKNWGSRNLKVTVWEYADGKPNGFKTAHR